MFGGCLRSLVRGLTPSYFATVMATGIVSVGLAYDGRRLPSRCLLALTVAAFVGLVLLNAWRLVSFRDELVADLVDPGRGVGFFTFVAAADVLAARVATSAPGPAVALLVVAAACWLVRGYAVPWTIRRADASSVLASVDGTWFLWPVGAQSVAVAAAVLAVVRPGAALPAMAVAAWFLGAALYPLVAMAVAARLLVHPVGPGDLTPPHWIAMGAAAITAVAGAEIAALPGSALLDAVDPLIRGTALGAWILATWLIPALVAAGWWRHVTHRVPLRYDVTWWSIVFPLGMYAVAGSRLGTVEHLPLLGQVGRVWIWVALAAWVATSAAAALHVVRRLLP